MATSSLDSNNNEGDSSDLSSQEVGRAMRRVSQASIPALKNPAIAAAAAAATAQDILQEHDSLSDEVALRMKRMLQSVRAKRAEMDRDSLHLGNDDNEEAVRQRSAALATLSSVPPFSYLPQDERRALVQDLRLMTYADGDVIIQQGDKRDRDVFVTTTGRVMLVHLKGQDDSHHRLLEETAGAHLPYKFLGYMDAPAVFGEYEPLFEMKRMAQVVAVGSDAIKAYRMSGDRFLRLLAQDPSFKLKVALGMRNKGLFSDVDSFVATVYRSVALAEQQMDFGAMLQSYRRMVPAIHARLHSSELDIEGWTYAVRRLPDTVTSTYVYLLSNSVPMPFMHENFDLAEISVPSAARRRLAFAVDQSKLLVIMREKFSDVLDFISLLCAHIHESAKLRLKLSRKPVAFDVIHGCLWAPERRVVGEDKASLATRTDLRFYRHAMYTPVPVDEQATALAKLPLNEDEIRGLQTLWPKDFLYRVWDMIAMHENIQVRGDFSASYVESTDRWAESIRSAVIDLLKQRNGDNGGKQICVSTDLTTHIISSNTTSVRNLLSPYIRKHAAKILKWGAEAHPEMEKEDDLSESDKLCALCTAYMRAHADAPQEQENFDASCIKILRHTELTGIQVELIDLDTLCDVYAEHNIQADPYLAEFFSGCRNNLRGDCVCDCRRRLLVNIDYAFGKQAEQIMSALCLLFGKSITSVGVMGKAGGLQGKRGDIVVADFLLHQDGDEITPIDNHGVDREALASLSGRKVWSGGVLTVLGTLLQDKRLLQYYKKLMGCCGLEMEGSFYARELMRFKKSNLMSEKMHMRFMYYFSDTPLSSDQNETLSKDLGLSEVIPPQYAVTRELLRLVLSDE